MNNGWNPTKLGEILNKSREWIELQSDKTYRQVTVRLWGKGVTLRGEITGAEIAATRQCVVRARQFIASRIDARNGAFGLIPDSLDGAIVTSDFPVFSLNETRMLPDYLHWLSKTAGFVELCKAASEGTTNRVRLKEDRFLALEIPLPPVPEQRRIVTRIEQLAAQIEEARSLRRQAAEEAQALFHSALHSAFMPNPAAKKTFIETAADLLNKQAKRYSLAENVNYNGAHPGKPDFCSNGPYPLPSEWVWTTLGSVLTHLVDCVNDTPDFADEDTGLFGLKTTNVRPYQLDLKQTWFMTPQYFDLWNRRESPRAGDLILTREAPMGNVCLLPGGINVCLTQRLMLLRSDEDFVLRRYLLHFLNSPHFIDQVTEKCRGLTTPHLRVKDAPHINVPLPPLVEQRRIVGYLDGLAGQVAALARLQSETAAELDALLPSILDKAFKGEL